MLWLCNLTRSSGFERVWNRNIADADAERIFVNMFLIFQKEIRVEVLMVERESVALK